VTHDDRPGPAQPLDREVVARGDAGPERHALRGALDVQVALDCRRDAVQRTEVLTSQHGGLGGLRLTPRPVVVEVFDGPEDGLVLLDAAEEVLEHLHRRHLLAPDEIADSPGRGPRQIVGHSHQRAAGLSVCSGRV
jgi:hypothetical protein